jgi:hypothetical protein
LLYFAISAVFAGAKLEKLQVGKMPQNTALHGFLR